jgi:hypothetical protein
MLLLFCVAGCKYGKGGEEMNFQGIFKLISVFRE